MKKFNLTLLVLFALTAAAMAQAQMDPDNDLSALAARTQALARLSANEINAVDLSGKYTGHRYQFTPDRKSIMQSFQYEFNLTQTGNIISGTSTIIKADGEYGDMKLRGMLVGDKLYFEEYEIVNQDKDPNMVWCFKTGALDIRKNSDNALKLTGVTDSYMPDYYLPCTGGTTDLTKVDNSNNFKMADAMTSALPADAGNEMMVYPNPFVGSTTISYVLGANAGVTLEVYDITGKKVATLENNTSKNAGAYDVAFSAKDFGLTSGVLIAKLTVNGKVYSSEMVEIK